MGKGDLRVPQAATDTQQAAGNATASRHWSPDWDARKAGKDCPHCLMIKDPDRQSRGLPVFHGDYVTGFLWRGGAIPGYTVAMWNQGHACEPHDLPPADAVGYWLEVNHLAAAIAAVVDPAKMNYETLGNAVPHLHTHIVPRLQVDPAPHEPLPGWCFDADPLSEDLLADTGQQIRHRLTSMGAPPAVRLRS